MSSVSSLSGIFWKEIFTQARCTDRLTLMQDLPSEMETLRVSRYATYPLPAQWLNIFLAWQSSWLPDGFLSNWPIKLWAAQGGVINALVPRPKRVFRAKWAVCRRACGWVCRRGRIVFSSVLKGWIKETDHKMMGEAGNFQFFQFFSSIACVGFRFLQIHDFSFLCTICLLSFYLAGFFFGGGAFLSLSFSSLPPLPPSFLHYHFSNGPLLN